MELSDLTPEKLTELTEQLRGVIDAYVNAWKLMGEFEAAIDRDLDKDDYEHLIVMAPTDSQPAESVTEESTRELLESVLKDNPHHFDETPVVAEGKQ